MKIISSLSEFPNFEKLALTIGNFDGIHLGHQSIMKQMHEASKNHPKMVLTFKQAPLLNLNPNNFLGYLTPLEYKIHWFRKHSFDYYANLDFSAIRELKASDFIDFLRSKVKKLSLYVGDNFRFGKGNNGNVHFLKSQEDLNFKVKVISRLKKGLHTVSSTTIRKLILSGKVKLASNLLGRPFFFASNQIKGDGIGAQIGFPTINTRINKQVIPQKGVYYTLFIFPQTKKTFPAMTYIGKRPTVNGSDLRIESHLLENEFPHCKNHIILFIKKTRNEKKMQNLEELSKILYNDKKLICALHQEGSFKNTNDQRLTEDFHALYQC